MVLSKGLVAVTGASGYIGSWCVKTLVQSGYQARGTVRSLKKTEKVQHLKDMEEPVHLFEADLLVEGSFDACFAGCTAVFHVASPFQLLVDNPQKDLIDPAVNGTLNVLESCKRAGVKRVILTSSAAAIVDGEEAINPEKFKDKVFSEKDWNKGSTLERDPYMLSKALAEKAAWDFCEKNGITLTTICPNFVMGPPLSTRMDATSINMIAMLMKGVFVKDGLPNLNYGLVDVRTVAETHVLALENERAENERFFIGSRNPETCLGLINYLKLDERFADWNMGSHFSQPVISNPRLDNSKAANVLGVVFKPPAIGVMEIGNFLFENGLVERLAVDEDEKKLSIE